jgi:predicted nucleic acid-binding protein
VIASTSIGAQSTLPSQIATDTNLWINAALPGHPFHASALDLVRDCLASGIGFIVPPLWEAEIESTLRMAVQARHLTTDAADTALQWFDAVHASPAMTVIYDPQTRLIARSFATALKQPRVYDATYVAIARLNNCDLWTADKRLVNAAQNAMVAARKRRRPLLLPAVRLIDTYTGEYAPTL